MSSVLSIAHETKTAASGVQLPTMGHSTSGIALHHTVRKREEWRVKWRGGKGGVEGEEKWENGGARKEERGARRSR